jgi:alkylation response protein AidB-like acyl-CoA dehydrogenase
MTTRTDLKKALADAETELEAAKAPTAVKAAAKKLQRAKAELKELEAQAPGRPKRRRAS